jgi:hypothetical protein
LAIQIRLNKNIKGITVHNVEKKISQLADGTSLILDSSKKSILETLETLKQFSEMSGLHINFDKTHILWIGSKKYSNEILLPIYKLKWAGVLLDLLY